MIYWFTGQPGHGKTLNALVKALDFQDEGRLVYVGNVRGLSYERTKFLPITPEQFCDWPNFLPDGAVCLIDEAYEHGMLPKRRPGSTVPHHVEQLAKHRHRGLDFIFVSQSPDRQCDDFVQDLIERHVHVRRRFGTKFLHLRVFDRYEKNPEKATPLVVKRTRLPKRAFGLYESTVMDTTEKSIPWYYIAAAVLLPAIIIGAIWNVTSVKDKLTGKGGAMPIASAHAATREASGENGAIAKVEQASVSPVAEKQDLRKSDFVAWLTPRIPGQPWTAPAYDNLNVPSQAPRLFCAMSGEGQDESGEYRDASCSCLTEQGTRYAMERNRCEMIVKNGQYEPFRDEVLGDRARLDDATQLRQLAEERERGGTGFGVSAAMAETGAVIEGEQISSYGDIKVGTP